MKWSRSLTKPENEKISEETPESIGEIDPLGVALVY